MRKVLVATVMLALRNARGEVESIAATCSQTTWRTLGSSPPIFISARWGFTCCLGCP